MSTVLIPMAGAGSRFTNAGYKLSKPLIPVIDRNSGEEVPMIMAALQDLPGYKDPNKKIILIDRDFHKKAGIEEQIQNYVPEVEFVTIDFLTDGQASTCLLAKDFMNRDEELHIGACDNGMDVDLTDFAEFKKSCDAIIFTYRNNEAVLENPKAYGWVKVEGDGQTVAGMSVKIPISETPMQDHAVVGSFWFKKASDFIEATEKMIKENDRINGEFYVDQTMHHLVSMNKKVKVFEVSRYHCWGTPREYENYQQTIQYWQDYVKKESFL